MRSPSSPTEPPASSSAAFRLDAIDVRNGAAVPAAFRDSLGEMLRGERVGVILRGAFEPTCLRGALSRLKRGETSLAARPSPYFAGRTFGRLLTPERDLDAYFDAARGFDAGTRALFAGLGDLRGALFERLAELAGGATVEPARDERDRAYLLLSYREMLPGAAIALHYENEAFDMPSMQALRASLASRAQLSVYIPLELPEGGGALRIYDVRDGTPECARFTPMDRESDATFAELEARNAFLDAGTEVGDLLVFDAGRHYHRVTRVTGERARWTMGCFVGERARDGAMVCWT